MANFATFSCQHLLNIKSFWEHHTVPSDIDSFILPSVSSVSDLGVVIWIARLNLVSIATNCALKPVFVLDRFYVVFDASVL